MSVSIRSASPADSTAILALMPRLAEFSVPESRVPEHLWVHDAALLQRWADGDADECLVRIAESADRGLAGFTLVSLRPELLSHEPSAHLEAIAVAPGFEGQGIGALLLRDAEATAAEQGALTMTLHVFAANVRARALYERAGFDGELMRYIKPLPSE